ncbi:hypothetical protein MKW98_020572 [Papaver atlanticum]|uniref:Uncharacterized protein n=1 Tax=Papaver atlanticum TaxID=357466 RepID=A0AAD4T1V4_9MAGN|nr:hypothetical protein MKW98_020572 [Papaver atlanticum]
MKSISIKSRGHQKSARTMGRKNFSQCTSETAQKNEENQRTEVDLYIEAHVNKDSRKATQKATWERCMMHHNKAS